MRRKGESGPLSDDEVQVFLTTGRSGKRPTEHSRSQAMKLLRLRNPWRWRRMQKDVRWARKQLDKMGYDPEEIRWLL
jgi:hypothetical protein